MRSFLIIPCLLVILTASASAEIIPTAKTKGFTVKTPTVRVIGKRKPRAHKPKKQAAPKAPKKQAAPKAPKLPAIPAKTKRASVRTVSAMEVSGVNEAIIVNPFCKGKTDGDE